MSEQDFTVKVEDIWGKVEWSLAPELRAGFRTMPKEWEIFSRVSVDMLRIVVEGLSLIPIGMAGGFRSVEELTGVL